MLSIPELLTKNNIYFRDSGPNCSRNNLVVKCPLCQNDPSEHCAIALDGSGFYCFRNRKHKGSLKFLLSKLGIAIDSAAVPEFTSYQRRTTSDRDYKEFQYFLPAEESIECLEYLESRGFVSPYQVCEKFQLKYVSSGKWAGRLIIPLNEGWTARSMRGHIQPRYLAETATGLFVHGSSSSCILVEGAIDAMRISVLTNQFMICATGGLGRIVSPSVILFLMDNRIKRLYYIPDRNVESIQILLDKKQLIASCPSIDVVTVQVPNGYKDPAEVPQSLLVTWINNIDAGEWRGFKL